MEALSEQVSGRIRIQTQEPYPIASTVSKFAHVQSPDSRALFKKKEFEGEKRQLDHLKEALKSGIEKENQSFSLNQQRRAENNSQYTCMKTNSPPKPIEKTEKVQKQAFKEIPNKRESIEIIEKVDLKVKEPRTSHNSFIEVLALPKNGDEIKQRPSRDSETYKRIEEKTKENQLKEREIKTPKQLSEIDHLKEFFWDLVEPVNDESSMSVSLDPEHIPFVQNDGKIRLSKEIIMQSVIHSQNQSKSPKSNRHNREGFTSNRSPKHQLMATNNTKGCDSLGKEENWQPACLKEKKRPPKQIQPQLPESPNNHLDLNFERERCLKEEKPSASKNNKYSALFERKQQKTASGYAQRSTSGTRKNSSKSRSPLRANEDYSAHSQNIVQSQSRGIGQTKERKDCSASRKAGAFDRIFQDVRGSMKFNV